MRTHGHSGWTPFYFMYDPKCSTTFPWCTINAPAAFAWCTINVPAVFAWCTNHFVHKVEFSYIGWNGVHPLWWCRHLNSATILLCHLVRPHESIPLPRSSQCRAPLLRAHINQSYRPDLVSVVRPHGSPPQINSITPIQSCASMARPLTQSHRPHPASVLPPWRAPTNQSHLPDPVAHPHDASP